MIIVIFYCICYITKTIRYNLYLGQICILRVKVGQHLTTRRVMIEYNVVHCTINVEIKKIINWDDLTTLYYTT